MHKTLVALTLILSTAFATLGDSTLTATSASAAAITLTGAGSSGIGKAVADAGDFNADATRDYLVVSGDNKVYVVLGKTPAREAVLDLAGTQGTDFLLITVTAGTSPVVSTAAYAGDINGDNVADIVIGISNTAEAYVVYGKATGTWTTWETAATGFTIDTAFVTGPRGIQIKGASGSQLGAAVSAGGDLNGDGKDDVLIGQPGWDSTGTNNEGAVCVVYGKALVSPTGAGTSTLRGNEDVDCSTNALLNPTPAGAAVVAEGILITGATAGDGVGNAIALVGDLNNDNRRDVIIGATAGNLAYIVYGLATSQTTAIDLAATTTPLKYTKITGPASGATSFASAVAGGADFNGDNKPDAVIGHPAFLSGTKTNAGRVYVIFASTPTTAGDPLAAIDFTGTVAATRAITYTGPLENGYFGADVDIGDVNGDGVGDLVVGAPLTSGATRTGGTGKVYAIYGKASPTTVDIGTTALTTATGITITGPTGASFGVAVAAVDVTKDSIADIIVGAPTGVKSGGTGNGLVYEIRGQKIDTTTPSGSGATLSASLLVLASFFVALMF